MATYTSNYGWTKPSGSDNVDISVLNDNLDGQDSVIHDAFLNMAVPFSELSTYAVDDIVLYGTGLYKCHTAVVTPGSWTGSTNWQVYKLSEGGGGGGGTSNYNQLTNKPQINSVELSGNKTTSDLGISYNDLTNKPSLATVATSGSYADLSNKPENANTFQGTIAEWNQLTTAEKKAYDHASIPDSIDGGVTFPADKVVMTGGGNVEDAVDEVAERAGIHTLTGTTMADLRTAIGNLTEAQKLTAAIKAVTQYGTVPILRVTVISKNTPTIAWCAFVVTANVGAYQYKLDSSDGSFVQVQDNSETTVSLTLESWTLLYFG